MAAYGSATHPVYAGGYRVTYKCSAIVGSPAHVRRFYLGLNDSQRIRTGEKTLEDIAVELIAELEGVAPDTLEIVKIEKRV